MSQKQQMTQRTIPTYAVNTSAWQDHLIYFLSIAVPFMISLLYVQIVLRYFHDPSIDSVNEALLFGLKFFWLITFIFIVTNITGILLYGSPRPTNRQRQAAFAATGWDKSKKLVLVYVSRGENHQALKRAVDTSYRLLRAAGVHFAIEIVSDLPVAAHVGTRPRLHFYVVPEAYQPANGAQWKARALQYLIDHSQTRHNAFGNLKDVWLLHLDEESCLTRSAIAGIHHFVTQAQNAQRIGQGEIKYNAHHYGRHLLITALDSMRTGDDLGRFRFQYKYLQAPTFGMHGSFILVPAAIERTIGFDHGGRGSVTEDAYFALTASARGVSFGWVDGYIREQSPYTLWALIQQRRRWICGLRLLSGDRQLQPKVRLPMAVFVTMWMLSWPSMLVTIVNILVGGGYFTPQLAILAALLGGGIGTVYLLGAYRNLQDMDFSPIRKISLYCAVGLLIPVASLIESIAVIYALLKPVTTFDVVAKN